MGEGGKLPHIGDYRQSSGNGGTDGSSSKVRMDSSQKRKHSPPSFQATGSCLFRSQRVEYDCIFLEEVI